ncbi:MAG: NADPH-dependent F420 reductase [Candidatus Hadarchaeales archaeon]
MQTIAVIGGTGDLGRGLVARWVLGEEKVIIGSRSPEKAKKVAEELSRLTGREIGWGRNSEAARLAEIVVLSVPFAALSEIAEEIRPEVRGKIVLSVIVPLKFEGGDIEYIRPESGSAAEEVAKLLPEARVVSAFHTVGAKMLQDIGSPVPCDVVICGDDLEAKKRVIRLINHIPGMRAIDGGPLKNSRLVEVTVALLVELSRMYGVPGVSLKFEGL